MFKSHAYVHCYSRGGIYAATVHKAQGGTVDRAFVLATPGMDRHLSYVGMTRHREEARLYAGNDDFKDFEALKERLSRIRPKDTTLDYTQRRGFEVAAEPMREAFQYLTDPQRHASVMAASPSEWMPWNYQETLDWSGGPR